MMFPRNKAVTAITWQQVLQPERWKGEVGSYAESSSSRCGERIKKEVPRIWISFSLLKRPNVRVTVSRELPTTLANSSCVSAMVNRIWGLPHDAALPKSSSTLASRPAAEPESPRRRASKNAALYSSESALAACRLASPCFWINERKSSRRILLTSVGSIVSAVAS
jgi:hypothetical protein